MSSFSFKGRTLVFATMHQKERILRTDFLDQLGITLIAANAFNSDAFGTFSGEIERAQTPLETARLKCEAVFAQTQADMVMASEGTFGAHPHYAFLPGNNELLLLVDKRLQTEFVTSIWSTATNFNATYASNRSELMAFAEQIGFPEHALILKSSETNALEVNKGIHTEAELLNVFAQLQARYGKVYLETDMRALYNPKRQAVISEAGKNLIELMASTCPNCQFPGFAVTEYVPGLPCTQCQQPTRAIREQVRTCKNCKYQSAMLFPNGKFTEDPMYCNYCNP